VHIEGEPSLVDIPGPEREPVGAGSAPV
jgi:hypothetical protein